MTRLMGMALPPTSQVPDSLHFLYSLSLAAYDLRCCAACNRSINPRIYFTKKFLHIIPGRQTRLGIETSRERKLRVTLTSEKVMQLVVCTLSTPARNEECSYLSPLLPTVKGQVSFESLTLEGTVCYLSCSALQ